MRPWLLLLVSVIWVVAAPAAEGKRVRLQPGDPAPELGLVGAGSQPTTFADHGMVIIFVHAGQTRSDTLLAALPALQEKIAADRVALIVIASGKGPLPALPDGVTARLVHDANGKMFRSYGVVVSPATTVVDRKGHIAASIPSLPQDYAERVGTALDLIAGRTMDTSLLHTGPTSVEKEARLALERARQLQRQGQRTEALAAVRKALDLTPDDLDAQLTVAELLLTGGDAPGARNLCEKVLKSHPGHPQAMTILGRALAATGATERAAEVLREAIRGNPNPVHAHYALGRLYEQQGKMADAAAEYQRALSKLAEGRR